MIKSTKQLVQLIFFCLIATKSLYAADLIDYQTRIVGGAQIQIQEAPSTVALLNIDRLYQTGSYYQSQFCGGTVIAAQWVITAAHCLISPTGSVTQAQDIAVLMGSSDLDNPVNQPVGVTRVITHERYDGRTNANDIALLQLEYAAVVPSTPLDTQNTTINDLGLIAGWGALAEANSAGEQFFPRQLQGAYVRMIPGAECEQIFQAYAGQIDDSNLCAGLPEGGVDSCQGDSGGPMYRFDSSNPAALTLAGVVSWGHGCADASAPGIYMRVAAYQSWINGHTNSSATTTGQTELTSVQTPTPVTGNPSSVPDGSNSVLTSRNISQGGASGIVMTCLLGLIGFLRLKTRNQDANHNVVDTDGVADTTSRKIAEEGQDIERCAKNLDERLVTQLDWLGAYPVGLCSVIAIVLVVALPPADGAAHELPQALALHQLVDGKDRDTVLTGAQKLWEQTPTCTVVRTGYGVGRRAFFMENCGFSVQRENTICGALPTWVDYRFLENELIQVSLVFGLVKDEDSYRECVKSLSLQSPVMAHQAIFVDEQLTTRISNAEAMSQIHRIQ